MVLLNICRFLIPFSREFIALGYISAGIIIWGNSDGNSSIIGSSASEHKSCNTQQANIKFKAFSVNAKSNFDN